MEKPFSFMSMINKNSKPIQVKNLNQITGQNDFEVIKLDVYKIHPSKDNFYSVEEIRELADSIKMFGIRQNLEVTPIPEANNYKAIAGHRRRLATLMLLEDGEPEEEFRYIPCRVVNHTDEIEENIILIHLNSTVRKFSAHEYLEQYRRLQVLITDYKKHKHVPGRVIEHIAKVLGISASQVERIATIDKKLEPEFKEELKSGNISFNAAAELARLSPEDQKAVYEQHQETGATDIKTVRKQKAKTEQPKAPDPINPAIAALLQYKALLEREIAKINKTEVIGGTVEFIYREILVKKVVEAENELFTMQGLDIFNNTGAEG